MVCDMQVDYLQTVLFALRAAGASNYFAVSATNGIEQVRAAELRGESGGDDGEASVIAPWLGAY